MAFAGSSLPAPQISSSSEIQGPTSRASAGEVKSDEVVGVDATVAIDPDVYVDACLEFEVNTLPSTLGVFGMLVKKMIAIGMDALEKRLDNKSRKEALSVVASAINSFTDRVFLIPLQIQHVQDCSRRLFRAVGVG